MSLYSAPRLKDDGTRCFGHPRAASAHRCTTCGRGMCAVCTFDCQDGQHLCPRCVALADDLAAGSQRGLRWSYQLAGVATLCLVSGQTASADILVQMGTFLLRYLAPLFAILGYYLARRAVRLLDLGYRAMLLNAVLSVLSLAAWLTPLLTGALK